MCINCNLCNRSVDIIIAMHCATQLQMGQDVCMCVCVCVCCVYVCVWMCLYLWVSAPCAGTEWLERWYHDGCPP